MSEMSDDVFDYEDYEDGRNLYGAGKFEEAIRALEKTLKTSPHYKTFEIIGDCYARLDNRTNALTYMLASIAMHPSPRACYWVSNIFIEIGDKENAVKYLKKAISLQPNYKKARDMLLQIEGG